MGRLVHKSTITLPTAGTAGSGPGRLELSAGAAESSGTASSETGPNHICATADNVIHDEGHLYCRFCFEEELAKKDGLLVKVYKSSPSTSMENWLNHANSKHSDKFRKDISPKIMTWFNVAKEVGGGGAATEYEYKYDLALMVCRDLQPFAIADKPRFKFFCSRNTTFEVPSSDILASTALFDVYFLLKDKVIETLKNCTGGCLMMNSWTDKHRARPYFTICISVISE